MRLDFIFSFGREDSLCCNLGMKKYISISLLAVIFPISLTWACMGGRFNSGPIAEGTKDVFVFHDGKKAHMVIQTSLSAKKFPPEIVWVLPFPSLPTKYEEIDGPIFEELDHDFVKRGSALGARGGGPESFGGSGVKVHKTVSLGQYRIQPIEILKDNSDKELNDWLVKNKFNPIPTAGKENYLKKGSVFLAIRMKLNEPNGIDLVSRPLHVVYSADRVVAPMRFFVHNGATFDMNLYVFSKKEMKKDLSSVFLQNEGSVPYKTGGHVPFVDSLLGKNEGYITKYYGQNINGPTKKVGNLTDDPGFSKAEF
jgi:hypothetical protein